MSQVAASDLTRVLLFAPRNCTGNSGAVGDTILQTSFVRTLLDRSLFPGLQEIHWWGTKWVIDELFDYFHREVVVHNWAGEADELDKDPQYVNLTSSICTSKRGESAVLICTRNESVEKKVKDYEERVGQAMVVLSQISEDTTTPRNIRRAAKESMDALQMEDLTHAVRASNAISMLDDILQDPNMPPYTRVKLWNVISFLEAIKD